MARIVRPKPEEIAFEPHKGAQEDFLACPTYECLLSGGRGGGKTLVLLADFLQDVGQGYGPDCKGVLFRQEFTQLTDAINKSHYLFPKVFPGAVYNSTEHMWRFPEGEKFYLRYIRVPEEFQKYQGFEFSILSSNFIQLGNNEITRAENIKVGSIVQTLNGPKRVNKVMNYRKPGVKISVYDPYQNLVGEQYQGVMHPVLTTYGWQRLGLFCLSDDLLQSQFGEFVNGEIHKFLSGIHQEILASFSHLQHNSGSLVDHSISSMHRQLFSSIHQIYNLLLSKSFQNSSVLSLHPCTDLNNHSAYSYALNGESVFEWLMSGPRKLQLLLQYCEFLINFLLQVRQYRLHQLHSILYHLISKPFLQLKGKLPFLEQYPYEKCYDPMQLFVLNLLMQDQIAWNDTFSYVQSLKKGVLNFQSDYHHGYDSDGELPLQVLGTYQSPFPSENGVQVNNSHCCRNTDEGDISQKYNHTSYTSTSYIHPYTHAPVETNHHLIPLSFEISPVTTPLSFVDFEVQDVNHYLSPISIIDYNTDTVSSQGISGTLSLINQNCWIGWEELTNFSTDECYKLMMTCNRSPNPKINLRIRSTCNPAGPGHQWCRRRFIDVAPPGTIYKDPDTLKTRSHIFAPLTENLTLLKSNPDYLQTLILATQDDPVKYKAWVLGSWDIVAGGFFADLWEPNIHIIKTFPFPSSWRVSRSYDWGSTSPWAVSYVAECNGEQPEEETVQQYNLPYFPKGSAVVINEIYGWNGTPNVGDRATSQVQAERILSLDKAIEREYKCKVYPGPADLQIWTVIDGTSIANNMSTYGLWWTRAYKGSGSIVSGLSLIRTMLGASKRNEPENPHLYFFEEARHHIRTIPEMQHDKKEPEKIPENSDNHLLDALRYNLSKRFNNFTQRKVNI